MIFVRLSLVAVACLMWLGLGSHSSAAEIASPLSPADAQKEMRLADASLRIELAAAEPDVIDPVAIRFDEEGRMWVVEMRDYPLGVKDGPASRIRVLEDTDGDGRFEKATTFSDKLLFVTGLQPWKGGVFVTLAGRVAYMKDTDGDGRSDVDETWFEGFAEQNSQLRANHPRLALDNHIYVANGLRGGKVINRKLKETTPIDISGMDFRFDPLTGKAEAVSGNGQFGLCFDDWGNRFTVSNRNPCKHVVIQDRYLKASPGVTVSAVINDVAAAGEQSRIFAISRAWTTSNLHAGQFTAACGVYIYRGDLLPSEFKGNVFTCDPTGNLIHREIVEPSGPTFTSKPAYEGKEFLASADEWFRPVNMELGPDGALYVVDMYRCVIEHPDFVPTELKNRPDQRLGDDRGRIWRILPAPTNSKRQRVTSLSLSTAAASDLVALLEHPNAWQRETAQRLLVERSDKTAESLLSDMARSSKEAVGRSCALSTLAGLEALKGEHVLSALKDPSAQVRRQAILLAERFPENQAIKAAVSQCVTDEAAMVRFQANLTGALLKKERRSEILPEDANDPWMRASIKIGLGPESAGAALAKLLKPLKADHVYSAGELTLIEELSEMAADPKALRTLPDRPRELVTVDLNALLHQSRPEVGVVALKGRLRGLARGGPAAIKDAASAEEWKRIAARLAAIASDQKTKPALRESAISVLAYIPDTAELLVPLTVRDAEQATRVAAIASLARQPGLEAWQTLLDGFASDTPAARRAIIDGVLARPERTLVLLDRIEAGRIKPSELEASQAKRLTESRDKAIRERAGKLFAAATPAERLKALEDYQPVLKMEGSAKRGQIVFEKNCSACHKIAGIGVNVAPDISDSRTKTTTQLLGDIMLPNKAIDNNYIGYTVRLVDGTVATGILATETATSITLRQQGNKELVIPRSEIEELKSSGLSLMPEGLERQIPPQDMADLLSFIKNWRYLDGRTPVATGK